MTFEGETLEEAVHAFTLYEEDHGSSARPRHIIKAELIGESLNKPKSLLDKKIAQLEQYLENNQQVGDGGLELEYTLLQELKKIRDGK